MKYPNDLPAVLTYGGGTNSSAILVELIKRGYEPPELIIFADTGAEMPHTYAHIKIMSEYAVKHGYPAIRIVRNEQPSKNGGNIYDHCLDKRMLPGIAYGHKNCSVQFKIEPVQKHVLSVIGKNNHVRIIGYDFDEIKRAENTKGKQYDYEHQWFPLIEWEMGRDECVKSLIDAGLPLAGKSSCFICPNMRPHEIKKMAAEYPNLMAKAIDLEYAAAERRFEEGKQSGIYGLGRTWRWEDLIATDDMFGFTDLNCSTPCGCYDGDD